VVVREGGETEAETLFLGYLVIVGIYRIEYDMVCREMRDCLGAGDSRSWNDAVYGVYCTQCMYDSVYTALGVRHTRCMLTTVYAVLGVRCTWC
jgi:hypothetical protein